ncbi:MAG: efflux RND transporter periplasmic adaptor subunit [Nostoc sp.]|uniref:efflux RND transporter periplasmic adaptor subunit n=1 Tax=Nostoc sp. TaxID=1180 RepID=UPI002FF47394
MQLSIIRRIKKTTPWLIGLVASGLLGIATTVTIALRDASPKSDITQQTVAVVSKGLIVRIKANGVVQAVRKINLSPKAEGRIVQLSIEEGKLVQQGELVAHMDSQRLQAQINQYKSTLAKAQAELAQKQTGNRPEDIAEAKARVATAEASIAEAQAKFNHAREELKRYQSLVEQGAVSRNQFGEYLSKEGEARATLQAAQTRLQEQKEGLTKLRNGTRPEEIAQAQASVAEARGQLQYYEIQLQDTQIQAPFSGTITRLFVQEGDFVTPTTSASSGDGATSASIAELSSGLEIEAKVPEASIAQIKVGQRVEIKVDAYPDDVFTGPVRLIAPRAVKENNITSFRVKVAVQTGQEKLKFGMNVQLAFLAQEIRQALVVPLATIITRPNGQTGVLLPNEDNQAQFRSVTVGATVGDQIQIIQGVSEGEQVFISPPEDQEKEGIKF